MKEYIQQGFVRQRRNFLLVSIVLYLYENAQISISKVSILGNEFIIEKPEVINHILWLFFAYMFVRYFHYFNDLPDREIEGHFLSKMLINLKKAALKHFIKEKDPRTIFPDFECHRDITYEILEYDTQYVNREKDEWSVGIKVSINIAQKEIGKYASQSTDVEYFGFKSYELVYLKMKSIAQVLIKRRFFFEYYMPFIVGLAVIAVKAYEIIIS